MPSIPNNLCAAVRRGVGLRAAVLVAFAGAAVVMSGCWSFQPGDAARSSLVSAQPEGVPPEHWPPRDAERLKPIAAATPMELRHFALNEGVDPATITDLERSLLSSVAVRLAYSGLHKYSLLRIEAPRTAGGTEAGSPTTPSAARLTWKEAREAHYQGFIANAHALSSRTIETMEQSAAQNARLSPKPEPGDAAAPSSEGDGKEARPESGASNPAASSPAAANPGASSPAAATASSAKRPVRVRYTPPPDELLLGAGKPIRIPLPQSIGGDAPERATGVLLHFQSLGGNDFEPKVLDEFKRRGWLVINFMTESFIDSPVPPEWEDEVRSLRRLIRKNMNQMAADNELLDTEFPSDPASSIPNQRRRSLSHPLARETNKAALRLWELLDGSFQACDDESLPAVAKDIAARIDQALAGNAYVVEAVLDYLDTQRPELKGLPIAMIGFSAGALAAPTAAMRVLDRVDAVVLIGGGANLFMLSQESALTDGGLRLRCGEEKLPKERLEKLSELYLRQSKLDPYHTAPQLSGVPVLQVHARTDGWVPAKGGRLLYERLGRPDMLEIDAGHQLLFFFLPGKSGFIADWVERAVGMKQASQAATGGRGGAVPTLPETAAQAAGDAGAALSSAK
jgi:hypothetical protein